MAASPNPEPSARTSAPSSPGESALASLAAAAAGPNHRERLVLGMVAAVAERGYAATTITDVVRHARVSRRTFYEHFADKEACFLAAYDAVSDGVLGEIAAVPPPESGWEQHIIAGVHAYLHALAEQPAIARVFTVDILSAGPAALARRREVLRRFAAHVQAQVAAAIAAGAPVAPLADTHALALVGAIHELVLAALEEDRGAALPELEDDVAALVSAVLLR
jgi:AcrR family transcriptional regulator